MRDVSLPHLLSCLPDPAAVTDAAGQVLSFNDDFCRATRSPAADLYGRSITRFIHAPSPENERARVNEHFTRADTPPLTTTVVFGRRGWRGRRYQLRIGRIDRGGHANFLVVLRDVQPQRQLHRGFRKAARTDALTGLLNRGAFTEEMELALLRAHREEQRLALLFIDLDGFKLVNDGHGHEAGDTALVEIARRFARAVRRDDLLARWGGDEFACLVSLPNGDRAVFEIAERLLTEAGLPLPAPIGLGLGASIGIARVPDDATAAGTLLSCADQALYEAKARRGRTWCAYAPEIAQRSSDRARLRTDLKRAIHGEELSLYYQPIVDAETLEPRCFEALIRWLHPERGVLAPGAFLGLLTSSAERTLRLLEVQIERALADADHLLPLVGELALNVDARLIGRNDAFDLLAPLHARLKSAGAALCVELTEVAFDEQPQKLHSFIQEVRHQGMRLAIDDFGVGQASLLRLREINFDILKVDRAFIRSIAVSARDRTISALAAKVAGELSGTSVAEGVETAAQVAWARRLGYNALQGFRIGRPMPAAELPAWYQAWQQTERSRLLAEMTSTAAHIVRRSNIPDLSNT